MGFIEDNIKNFKLHPDYFNRSSSIVVLRDEHNNFIINEGPLYFKINNINLEFGFTNKKLSSISYYNKYNELVFRNLKGIIYVDKSFFENEFAKLNPIFTISAYKIFERNWFNLQMVNQYNLIPFTHNLIEYIDVNRIVKDSDSETIFNYSEFLQLIDNCSKMQIYNLIEDIKNMALKYKK